VVVLGLGLPCVEWVNEMTLHTRLKIVYRLPQRLDAKRKGFQSFGGEFVAQQIHVCANESSVQGEHTSFD